MMPTLSIPVESAEFAAPPATNIKVDRTPTMGQNGRILRAIPPNNDPVPKPPKSGRRTRPATERSIDTPSTATTVCNNCRIKSGVIITPKTVVERVQTTDRATSPPANNVNKLEACPPLTEPRSTIPAVWLGVYRNTDAIPIASSGISPKHSSALRPIMAGLFTASAKSLGVMASPIASMSIDREFCITGSDPSVGATVDDFRIPMRAASRVHSGARLQTYLERDLYLPGLSSAWSVSSLDNDWWV